MRKNPIPRNLPVVNRISGKELAFAIIVHGGQYEQIKAIFQEVGLLVLCKSAYDTAQKEVCKMIIEFGNELISKWRNDVIEDSIICIYGCWDHPRNGSNCVVTVFDNKHWKIIGMKTITKGINYEGASSGMESIDIERLIQEFKEDANTLQPTVCSFNGSSLCISGTCAPISH